MSTRYQDVQHFIIVFDRLSNEQQVHMYGQDLETAARDYARYEEQYRDQPHIDVLLAGAQSLDVLRETHSTFFPESGDVLANYLREVAPAADAAL